MQKTPRKLGSTQEAVLRCLQEHKGWSPGCGWYWNNPSGTQKTMESLVERGLVDRKSYKSWRGMTSMYTINAKGNAELLKLFSEKP